MNIDVTTHNPARADVPAHPTPSEERAPADDPVKDPACRPSGRGWAVVGAGSGLLALVGGGLGTAVSPVYDESLGGDADLIFAALGDFTGVMIGYHVLETLAALGLLVLGLGLHRRLRESLGTASLLPGIAAAGLVATAAVLIVATGLDTELIFAVGEDHPAVVPELGALYNHWIGTLSGCWVLVGASALAVAAAARVGAVPRWQGAVGLVLGGMTVLVGVAPVQYMTGLTAGLWVLISALGFALGDRAHRSPR